MVCVSIYTPFSPGIAKKKSPAAAWRGPSRLSGSPGRGLMSAKRWNPRNGWRRWLRAAVVLLAPLIGVVVGGSTVGVGFNIRTRIEELGHRSGQDSAAIAAMLERVHAMQKAQVEEDRLWAAFLNEVCMLAIVLCSYRVNHRATHKQALSIHTVYQHIRYRFLVVAFSYTHVIVPRVVASRVCLYVCCPQKELTEN